MTIKLLQTSELGNKGTIKVLIDEHIEIVNGEERELDLSLNYFDKGLDYEIL